MTTLSTLLFTKRKPRPDVQPVQHRHPPAEPAARRPEDQQLQTTFKVVLGVICTVFFLAVGLPGPAAVALVAAFLCLRVPPRRR